MNKECWSCGESPVLLMQHRETRILTRMTRKRRREEKSLLTESLRDGHDRNTKKSRRVGASDGAGTDAVGGTTLPHDDQFCDRPCPMEVDVVVTADGGECFPAKPAPAQNTCTNTISQDADLRKTGLKNIEPVERARLVTPRSSIISLVSELEMNKLLDDLLASPASFSSTSSVSSIEVADANEACTLEAAPEIVRVSLEPRMATEIVESKGQDPPSISKTRHLFYVVLLAFLVILGAFLSWSDPSIWRDIDPHAIFVPGAGFSGFWFTLGRLRSIRYPASKTYYCYSAGCLGVVASLSNFTLDEMADMAFSVQGQWKRGEIHRHAVVGSFVDNLLQWDRDDRPMEVDHRLSRLNIITTVRKGLFGFQPCVRTPPSIHKLREMLLQTTWIPFAVGSSLWQEDSDTGERHIDGVFTALSHPSLANHLHLPIVWGVIWNALNVNLGRYMVEKLYHDGVRSGV